MREFGCDLLCLLTLSVIGSLGCSSNELGAGAGGSSSGEGGSFTATGGAPQAGTSGAGGASGGAMNCARETSPAKRVPLDFLLVLDASEAMRRPASADASRWSAVTSGVLRFLQEPSAAGLGVGLTTFPQRIANLPDSCTTDAACGEGAPCMKKICTNVLVETDTFKSCDSDSDCPATPQFPATCRTIGSCSTDPGGYCFTESAASCDGTCTATGACAREVTCEIAPYTQPVAPIAQLPAAEAALTSALVDASPVGTTATAPALEGALQQATAFAKSHLDHDVAAVLLTAGLPNDCLGKPGATAAAAIGAVADAARAGISAGVRTFVVGAINAEENASGAGTLLNSVAEAGGTERATIVDSSSATLSATIVSTLRKMISCQLDVAGLAPADYGALNVDFNQNGTTTRLPRVDAQTACDPARGGWTYVAAAGMTQPQRIGLCPASCEALKTTLSSSLQIVLGCETQR